VLSKNEIANILAEDGVAAANLVKRVMDGMAELAAEELASGEDFSVPGIARIQYAYTKPLAKGEKYKKGEEYTGFGGVQVIAEADSKERKASVKMKAAPAPALKRIAPKPSDKAAVRKFLSTKAGKNIVSRKG
jgi:nucleoid DNA-binding protein